MFTHSCTRIASVVVPLLVLAVGTGSAQMGGHGGGMGVSGTFAAFGGWGVVPALLLIGRLALLGYAVVSGIAGAGGSETGADSDALETLWGRYARDGTSDEEFEERRFRLRE